MVGGDFNAIRFVNEKSPRGIITCRMRNFEEFVREGDLWDVSLRNAKYTWSNGQDSPTLCRLDPFLVSDGWDDLYPLYFQEVRTKLTLDHWPMVLQTGDSSYSPKPFRFENMWTTHPHFKDLIKARWMECAVGRWGGYLFMQKLTFVKGKLWEWNKSTFGNLQVMKEKLCSELNDIDRLMEEEGGRSVELGVRRREIVCAIERNIKAEKIFWHQKAKSKWLKEGDENTRFFHKLANGKKRKNQILGLKVDEEEVVDFEDISNETSSSFERLYKKDRGERPVIDNLFERSLQRT